MTPIEVILERNRQTGNTQCSLDLHAGGRAHKTYSFVINALDYYRHYSHMLKLTLKLRNTKDFQTMKNKQENPLWKQKLSFFFFF